MFLSTDTNRQALLAVTMMIGVALAVAGFVRADGGSDVGSDYTHEVAQLCVRRRYVDVGPA